MFRNTSQGPRKAVRYTLILFVTASLVLALVGPAMMLTGHSTASAQVADLGEQKWAYTEHSNAVDDVASADDANLVITASGSGSTVHAFHASNQSREWTYNGMYSPEHVVVDESTGIVVVGGRLTSNGFWGARGIYLENGTLAWEYQISDASQIDDLALDERRSHAYVAEGNVYELDTADGAANTISNTSGVKIGLDSERQILYSNYYGDPDGDGTNNDVFDATYLENETNKWRKQGNDPTQLAADSETGLIFAANSSNVIEFYDANGTQVDSYGGHSGGITDLVWVPETERLLTASSDNTVHSVTRDAQKQWEHANHTDNVLGVAANPQRGEAYSASADTEVHGIYAEVDGYSISGQVIDTEDREGIANASVVVTDAGGNEVLNTTTGTGGFYDVEVRNGTYTVTADHPDYFSENATVTVDGASVVQDFELTPRSAALELDVKSYLKHGDQAPYQVIFLNITNGTVSDSTDVTDAATVTSGDEDVVTINTKENLVVATQNTSINRRTYIKATYTASDGTTYTTTRNITVANQTTENLEILPGTAVRSSAVLLDTTIQALIVATFIGIIGARIATSFAGLGMMQMTIMAGWFVGYVSVGMAMVSLFTALFIGLNMAANIDYTVRR